MARGREMVCKQVSCLLMSMLILLLKQTEECSANLELKFAGSCDFETEDLCGYVQGDRDDFNWRRRTGPTPSRDTGPDYDHTLGENGTGHYAFIEGTGVHAWNAAHLISPSLAPLTTYCATFFYHMYGDDTGELSLRVLDESQPEKPSEELWTMLWEQGNDWFNVSVDVQCERGCKLSFEAKPGNGYWSDTAIDDITVVNGSCYPEGDPSTITPVTTNRGTSTEENTSTEHPSTETGTHPSPHSTLDYQIIEYKYDERFITIILAVGLTFWSVVFVVIFVIFCYCDKRQNGGGLRMLNYDVTMDSQHPEKQSANMATYVEIDEQERESVEMLDGGEDDDITKLTTGRSETVSSDESSLDSERYSVPIITTPKPPRGPSPCGYMSLQLDSLNNNGNAEYQPLSPVDLTEVTALA